METVGPDRRTRLGNERRNALEAGSESRSYPDFRYWRGLDAQSIDPSSDDPKSRHYNGAGLGVRIFGGGCGGKVKPS